MPSQAIADQIAERLGGSVRAVPVEVGRLRAFAIALADGRVPVLVSEYEHAVGICVFGVHTWHHSAAEPVSVQEVVTAARPWADSHPVETVTILELALDAAAALSEAFADQWTIAIPGVSPPTEMWLHGRDFDAASVGIFEGRVVIWVERDHREVEVASRDELVRARVETLAGVREQLALYVRNRRLDTQIRTLARALSAQLGGRLGRDWASTTSGRTSHAGTLAATLACTGPDGVRRDVVQVDSERGAITIHAGLEGRDGWDGSAIDLEPIVVAITRMFATLTLEQLVAGKRYRVRETIGQLERGTIVKFVGFDDIDNHWGCYDFVTMDGKPVGVSGDYSSLRGSPLAETHRYLEPIVD